MVYYTYTISYCREYDYARYMEGSESVYSETKIPESEWKEIISDTFQAVFEKDDYINLDNITEYLVKHDKRLLSKDDLFIPIGKSEFWQPHWDNWDIEYYEPQIMKMYKKKNENANRAIFLIPSEKKFYEENR